MNATWRLVHKCCCHLVHLSTMNVLEPLAGTQPRMISRKCVFFSIKGVRTLWGINQVCKLNVKKPAEQHTWRPQDSKQIFKVWQWAFLLVGQAMACGLKRIFFGSKGLSFGMLSPLTIRWNMLPTSSRWDTGTGSTAGSSCRSPPNWGNITLAMQEWTMFRNPKVKTLKPEPKSWWEFKWIIIEIPNKKGKTSWNYCLAEEQHIRNVSPSPQTRAPTQLRLWDSKLGVDTQPPKTTCTHSEGGWADALESPLQTKPHTAEKNLWPIPFTATQG